MDIREHLRELAAKWINPEYAARFDPSHTLKDLIVHAFLNECNDYEDALLREAWKRLQRSALNGEFCYAPDE